VIIWDEGPAEVTRDEPGHLAFTLRGSKLAGCFALTRTGERRWILVKTRDATAQPGSDIAAERPASVRTGHGRKSPHRLRIDQPARASIRLLTARAAKTIVKREAAVTVNYQFPEVTPPSRRGSLGGPPLVSPPRLPDRSAEPEDGAVREQLVTRLLPVLAKKPQEEFNVFDVMRYGGHERQLSDVFAWLLDADGTHKLGDAFLRIFIEVFPAT